MGTFSCANLNNVKHRNNRLLFKSGAEKNPIKTDCFPMNFIIPNLFPNMLDYSSLFPTIIVDPITHKSISIKEKCPLRIQFKP